MILDYFQLAFFFKRNSYRHFYKKDHRVIVYSVNFFHNTDTAYIPVLRCDELNTYVYDFGGEG